MDLSRRSIFYLFLIFAVLAGIAVWPMPGAAQDAATTLPTDDWSRIQRTGHLLVATSPDNPPFSTMNAEFAMDGFDIALMQALADKLGVQVEFSAVVFPSLLDAIQLGQTDAAIAAIAITDGRQAEVDFTNPYYIGTEGILARSAANGTAPALTVASVADLAGHKIGAQAGTIYAGWLRENLIETGALTETALLMFNTVDQAIAALRKGDVDLVMLDALTAADYASQGEFVLAGQGLTRQEFGIALRKGSTLAQPLNDALLALQEDGTIAALASKYLAAHGAPPQPVVTPTPPPTPTPAPCTYFSRFVADLTYDDSRGAPQVQPDQTIDKSWRIMNTGTCPWKPDFQVVFYSGARLGGEPMTISRPVAPGETMDVAVVLHAPSTPGTYRSAWGLIDDQGQVFGQPFWATITVPGAVPPPPPSPGPVPTPQPQPQPRPQPAPPTINDFHASHSKVAVGLCAKLKWEVSGEITEVKIKRDGSNWKDNLGTSGSKKDCPSSDGKRVYELKVTGPGGTTRQTVEVKFKYMPLTGDAGEAPGGDD